MGKRAADHYREALDADWQDARRAPSLRWESTLGLVHALVGLDRQDEARETVERLSAELEAVIPGGDTPLQHRLEELRRAPWPAVWIR